MMIGTPLKHGEKIPGLPAEPWNAMLRLLGQGGGDPAAAGLGAGGQVRVGVHNAGAEARAEFAVVGLGPPAFTLAVDPEQFKRHNVYDLAAPVVGWAFGILQQPVLAGALGPAAVQGETFCTLNVTNEADVYAAPADGDYADLHTGATGPARVLWKETGTGAGKRARVLIAQAAAAAGGGAAVSGEPAYGSATNGPGVSLTGTGVDLASVVLTTGTYHLFGRVAVTAGSLVVGSPYMSEAWGTVTVTAGAADLRGPSRFEADYALLPFYSGTTAPPYYGPFQASSRGYASGQFVVKVATMATLTLKGFGSSQYGTPLPTSDNGNCGIVWIQAGGAGNTVSLVETDTSATPPAGHQSARLVTWDPATGYSYGGAIWLKNAGL